MCSTHKNQEVGGEEQVLDHVGEEPVHVDQWLGVDCYKRMSFSIVSRAPTLTRTNTDRDRPFRIHCPDITRSFQPRCISTSAATRALASDTHSLFSPFPYQSKVCHHLPKRLSNRAYTNQAAYLESSRNLGKILMPVPEGLNLHRA